MAVIRRLMLIVFFAASSIAVDAEEQKVGPWDLGELSKAPAFRDSPKAKQAGFKAILYQGLPYKGNQVEVFAYYSAPKGEAPEGGWPAVVCVHGGGGTAFPEWVRIWNRHGYAAISMDLEGHYPITKPDAEVRHDRVDTPNPGPSRVGVWHDYNQPMQEQWYYHAVAQIVLAHSLIRSFPEVDADRVGITGISWGGILTSTVMGADDRFKFAIPVYGNGYGGGRDGIITSSQRTEDHREFVAEHFAGSAYFNRVKIPTLWINGTNDKHFDITSTQQSAEAVQSPARLMIVPGMRHGHGPGWQPKTIYAFADSIVKDAAALPVLDKPEIKDQALQCRFQSERQISAAKLWYTTGTGPWNQRNWSQADASVDNGVITAALPDGATVVFLEVSCDGGLALTSPYLDLSPAE